MLKTVADVNQVALSIGDKNVKVPAEDGKNIVLTIDRNVQDNVEKILKQKMEEFKKDQASAVPGSLQLFSMKYCLRHRLFIIGCFLKAQHLAILCHILSKLSRFYHVQKAFLNFFYQKVCLVIIPRKRHKSAGHFRMSATVSNAFQSFSYHFSRIQFRSFTSDR